MVVALYVVRCKAPIQIEWEYKMLHCGIKENNVLKTRNKIILSRERNRKYVKDDVGVCR